MPIKGQSPDYNSMAEAMQWASKVSTVGLEMALPAYGGHLLDERWGTGFLMLLIGTVLGFSVGMLHLIRLTRPPKP